MRSLALLALTTSALAQSIYDISDVPAYSLLAPCAMTAISRNIYSLTDSVCPDGITALQSCACTKAGVSGKVAIAITKAVTASCCTTCTEDEASAVAVFSMYCNQATPLPTPDIKNELVSHSITDLPYYSQLVPCARSAVRYAVNDMTNYHCRPGAAEMNSCVCTKNQHSFRVSQSIASGVRNSCAESRSSDVTSALALFAGWCAMADGTTDFPAVSVPAHMSFYVNDMPEYSSLANCAARAVSGAVFAFTNYMCNEGPKALAGCVCEKDNNSEWITKEITDNVLYTCSSDATEDVGSAVSVFERYCGAARGDIKLEGVTASVPEPSQPTSVPFPAGTADSDLPTETGGSSNPDSNNDSDSSNQDPSNDPNSAVGQTVEITNTPAIIGAAVGGTAGGILLIGGLVWWWRRSRKQKRAAAAAAYGSNAGENGSGGVAEKDGTAVAVAGREGEELDGRGVGGVYKSPATGTTELASTTSGTYGHSPVSPGAELSGTPRPYGSELSGSGYGGYVPNVHEAPQGQYGHEMPGGQMGWQAGPYEMPAYQQGQQQYQQPARWQGGAAPIGRKPVGGA